MVHERTLQLSPPFSHFLSHPPVPAEIEAERHNGSDRMDSRRSGDKRPTEIDKMKADRTQNRNDRDVSHVSFFLFFPSLFFFFFFSGIYTYFSAPHGEILKISTPGDLSPACSLPPSLPAPRILLKTSSTSRCIPG